MSAALALLASLLWGTSDFIGGTASRRIAPYVVVGASEAVSFVGLLAYVVAAGRLDDPLGYLPWALASGVVGLVALGSFYAALAAGTMGVVAPIAAIGVVIPFGVGLAGGDTPTGLQYAGAALATLGVVLSGGPELRRGGSGRSVVLALVAAVGFGLLLTFIAEGSTTSVPMTLLGMRGVVVVVVLVGVVAARSLGGLRRTDAPMLVTLGVMDVASNAAYAVATTSGLISLTAVLASLYPAVTVLLARAVHGERLRRLQDVGVVLTLLGVVLIAGGGGTG